MILLISHTLEEFNYKPRFEAIMEKQKSEKDIEEKSKAPSRQRALVLQGGAGLGVRNKFFLRSLTLLNYGVLRRSE